MGFIADKIRVARERKNLTQQQLADLIDVNIKTIGRLEQGYTKTIKNDLLKKLSYALGTPVSFFYDDVSVSSKKDVSFSSVGDKKMSIDQKNILNINILSHSVSAGTSSEIHDIEVYDTDEMMTLSTLLFKTQQKAQNLRVTKVDGYSMIPMLFPDSWVVFDITKDTYCGDGLYVINFQNILMVKMLQITNKGTLYIKSVNKDYESWEFDFNDQSVFKIFGKVLRTII